MVTLGLAAICLLLLGYLLGNMRTEAERRQIEMGAVAHYGLFSRPLATMHEQLDAALDDLTKGLQAADALAKEHIGMVDEKSEMRKRSSGSRRSSTSPARG